VDNLFANLQTKIFCQNSSPATNGWASALLGERFVKVTSTSTGHSDQQSELGGDSGGSNRGVSRHDERRWYVEPATFATLRKGGPANDLRVDCIVYAGGKLFPGEKEEKVPYKLLRFRQE
jgi:hypothetical protein